MNQIVDALGNPIVLGQRYGYSRNNNGLSHSTIGEAAAVKQGKVRLINCSVKRFLYGEPTDYRNDEKPADVSINASMVFPVNI